MKAANLIALSLTIGMTLCSRPVSAERARDLGIHVGTLPTGPNNAITDVAGVKVGHETLIVGDSVRTGVTAIWAHGGNLFQRKVPAAVHVYNAFGKAAGLLQIQELGELETPIVLTNTLSVGTALEATVGWVLQQAGNEQVRSVNAVVGETNDGFLNDIRGQHIKAQHVIAAIENAQAGPVSEGVVGAGTGTRAFGYKGGIGTASRQIAGLTGKPYTIGVMVQANFGRSEDLTIVGVPVGAALSRQADDKSNGDGSCMIVIATDAPLDTRLLGRIARRAFNGMARTTRVMSNGSGDFAIAFSTAYTLKHGAAEQTVPTLLTNNQATPLFRAVEEATEEAIYNALFAAQDVNGYRGQIRALPQADTLAILRQHRAIEEKAGR